MPPLPRARRQFRRMWSGAAIVATMAVAIGGLTFLWWPGPRASVESQPPAESQTPTSGHPSPEPWKPRPARTPEELAKLTCAFDGRRRAVIPPALLALAGNGDPAHAPPELVAVFGDARFRIPDTKQTSWPATNRDGALVAVPCDGVVALYETATGVLRRTLTGLPGRAYCIAFSPDGARLAAGNWNADNTVRVWDIKTGESVFTLHGHTKRVNRVAFDPAGGRLATAASDDTVRVWDASTGHFIFQAAGAPENPYDVAYSPNGQWIASCGSDGHLWVWDAATGAEVRKIEAHPPAPQSQNGVAFSPDGAWLATASETEVKVWDTSSWQLLRTVPTPGPWVAFARDGRTLLAATTVAAPTEPNIVTRWDVTTGKSSGTITLHSKGKWATYHLARDGRTLYTMRCDPAERFLHTYDAESGAELSPPQGHAGAVWSLAFSPDGRALISGGADGTIRMWDLAGWGSAAGRPISAGSRSTCRGGVGGCGESRRRLGGIGQLRRRHFRVGQRYGTEDSHPGRA